MMKRRSLMRSQRKIPLKHGFFFINDHKVEDRLRDGRFT